MKADAIVRAAKAAGLGYSLVHTGQHYDPQLSQVFLDELGLPEPDVHLDVGSGTHAEQTAKIMLAFERELSRIGPRVVVVVGDVVRLSPYAPAPLATLERPHFDPLAVPGPSRKASTQ